MATSIENNYTPTPRRGRGYTVLPLSFRPSKIFVVTFFSVTVDESDGSKKASHDMWYLYEACDPISDFCHQ
jgi:hypothetical protein